MSDAKVNVQKLVIDGHTYVREDSLPPGNRCVVVVDRGWVFAGDVTRKDGRIVLTRAVHVRRWDSIGFDGVIANPKSEKVVLKKLDSAVDMPADAELFCIPVSDTWGL